MKKFFLSFLEVLEVVAVAFISVYIIYGFIAQPFLVYGASMEPSFTSGDYLLVDEITYRLRDVERSDVIVFEDPTSESEFLIKRVIGLPGEQIIINNRGVIIDGDILYEDYLLQGARMTGEYVLTLGDGEYFMMGDNRLQSRDSRQWGALDEDLIMGVVRLRFWPPTFFGQP